jgi:DNA-binding transcriptional LysR family regulator
MMGANLNDITVFVEVAKANGFRAAALNLNLAAGSVSETVQRIETRLGVRLFDRTTRKIALTSAGEKLYERSLPALNDLESALSDLSDEDKAVTGVLKLSAPRSGSSFFLDELVAEFCKTYPSVKVEVMYDDSKVDLVTSGIDAAIRSQNLLERETYAIEVGPILNMALVASPDYLKQMGKPSTPADLTEHEGICFAFGNSKNLAPWTFVEDNISPYQVVPKPRMVVNDLVSMVNLAKSGLGIAYTYKKPAEPYISSGELVALFDEYMPVLPRYTINYLTKRHMPARLRAFIELAKRMKY